MYKDAKQDLKIKEKCDKYTSNYAVSKPLVPCRKMEVLKSENPPIYLMAVLVM